MRILLMTLLTTLTWAATTARAQEDHSQHQAAPAAPAAGKVIETVLTSGEGVQEKFAVDGEKQMLNGAFRSNLDALLAKGLLQKYTQPEAAQ